MQDHVLRMKYLSVHFEHLKQGGWKVPKQVTSLSVGNTCRWNWNRLGNQVIIWSGRWVSGDHLRRRWDQVSHWKDLCDQNRWVSSFPIYCLHKMKTNKERRSDKELHRWISSGNYLKKILIIHGANLVTIQGENLATIQGDALMIINDGQNLSLAALAL